MAPLALASSWRPGRPFCPTAFSCLPIGKRRQPYEEIPHPEWRVKNAVCVPAMSIQNLEESVCNPGRIGVRVC